MGNTKSTAKKATAPKAVPAGAKLPQDHKAKDEPAPDVRVVTVRGKEFRIPVAVMDDFELLDDLNALDQREDATRMPAVLRRLVGDQWGEAMNLLRDKDTGRVTIEAGSEFVMELVEALNPNS